MVQEQRFNILKHVEKFIFFGFLLLFYGAIILRIEHWPFTDWGVFTYSYKPEQVFVFDLALKQIGHETKDQFLEKIGISAVGFNSQVTRSLYKKNQRETDRIVRAVFDQPKFRELAKNCPCEVLLIKKKVESIEASKISINHEVVKTYEFL